MGSGNTTRATFGELSGVEIKRPLIPPMKTDRKSRRAGAK